MADSRRTETKLTCEFFKYFEKLNQERQPHPFFSRRLVYVSHGYMDGKPLLLVESVTPPDGIREPVILSRTKYVVQDGKPAPAYESGSLFPDANPNIKEILKEATGENYESYFEIKASITTKAMIACDISDTDGTTQDKKSLCSITNWTLHANIEEAVAILEKNGISVNQTSQLHAAIENKLFPSASQPFPYFLEKQTPVTQPANVIGWKNPDPNLLEWPAAKAKRPRNNDSFTLPAPKKPC